MMVDMLESIEWGSTLKGGVVVSSREQASGMAQITESVLQMDQATQQNAGKVEVAAQTASSLQVETGRVHGLVAMFCIYEHAGATAGNCSAKKAGALRRASAVAI